MTVVSERSTFDLCVDGINRAIVYALLCLEAGSGRLGQSSWDVALAGPEQAVCTPRCELWKLLERWAWHGAMGT